MAKQFMFRFVIKFEVMVELIEIFRKYGGLGIISVWLFMTNSRVSELEAEIRDCNESKIEIYKGLTTRSETENVKLPDIVAILPDKIKFKKNP